MRWRLAEPVPYLVAFLLWIVALGVSPAPAAASPSATSVEAASISALPSDLLGHEWAAVEEADPWAEAEAELASSEGIPLAVCSRALRLPSVSQRCTRLEAPESVLLARVFEVSLAARGPPRA